MVLAFVEGEIYLGSFYAVESCGYSFNADIASYEKVNYKKTISFCVSLFYEKSECGDCTGDLNQQCEGQCADCCETDHEIDEKQLIFPVEKVSHWMEIVKPEN